MLYLTPHPLMSTLLKKKRKIIIFWLEIWFIMSVMNLECFFDFLKELEWKNIQVESGWFKSIQHSGRKKIMKVSEGFWRFLKVFEGFWMNLNELEGKWKFIWIHMKVDSSAQFMKVQKNNFSLSGIVHDTHICNFN